MITARSPRVPPAPATGLARSLRSAAIHLGRAIGHGATCTVHAATDAADRPVVVKAARHPTDATRDALRHEARVLERLRGLDPTTATGVPEVLHLVDTRRGPALVLRPRGDGTLDQWWHAPHAPHARPARDRALLDIASELVTVLAAIHAEGVVHGDLSPANVVLCGTRPVIVDFAGAIVDGVPPAGPCGTLPFAAPEVITGAPTDATTDLYALARIVVELLLGAERASGGDDERRDALEACGLGSSLVSVLLAALADDPSARPRHDAWLDALAGSSMATVPTDAPVVPGPVGAPGLSAARTRPFGPRPPARLAAPTPARRSWRTAILAGGAGLLAWTAIALATAHAIPDPTASGSTGAVALPPPDGASGTAPQTTTPAPTATTIAAAPTGPRTTTPAPPPTTPTTAAPTTPAPPPTTPTTTAPTTAPPPDLIRWDPARAEALVTTASGGVRRYRIGEPGDQLVVGRWACRDGTRPAVYRPATGDVFVFSGWADDHQALPSATVQRGNPVGGTLRRVTRDGCDTIAVDPPAADETDPPSAAPGE